MSRLSLRGDLVVLDTNVVSELMRTTPDAGVVAWVTRRSPSSLRTTAITIAEVRYGIARLPDGRRRTTLREAAEQVFADFDEAVLPFDAAAARHYADIVVEREGVGAPVSGFDAQIAAICRSTGAELATRNTADFEGLGLGLVDPWQPGA